MLIILFLLVLVFLSYFFWRDRRYQKTPLKELLSPQLRQELNLPQEGNPFPREVENLRETESFSARLLRLQNAEKIQDAEPPEDLLFPKK